MVVPLSSPESELDLESQGLLKEHSAQLDRVTSYARSNNQPRLQVQNLTLVAESGEQILNSVSFEVYPGQIVGLIGPSGSGKSTLLRALNRLWEPGKGTVLLDGVDITTLDVVKLRRRVGMLFQTAALFDGTVADNVRYGPKLRGRKLPESEVSELLEKAGLEPGIASKQALELSGGQAQRVSLARTLANSPDSLLLDEPTSALDPAATRRVEETLLRLREDTGLTIVLVSHSVDQIQRIADEVCLLVKGKILERGTPAELLNSQHPLSQQFVAGTLESAE